MYVLLFGNWVFYHWGTRHCLADILWSVCWEVVDPSSHFLFLCSMSISNHFFNSLILIYITYDSAKLMNGIYFKCVMIYSNFHCIKNILQRSRISTIRETVYFACMTNKNQTDSSLVFQQEALAQPILAITIQTMEPKRAQRTHNLENFGANRKNLLSFSSQFPETMMAIHWVHNISFLNYNGNKGKLQDRKTNIYTHLTDDSIFNHIYAGIKCEAKKSWLKNS